MNNNLVGRVGKYCRIFRLVTLEKTLRDVSGMCGSNEKSLSSFEHGRANNINHLACYVMACDDEQTRVKFYDGLTEIIKEQA